MMNRAALLVVISLGVLSGCQGQMRALESGGALRAERSTKAGSDYVVQIRNTVDFGFTPDNIENRHKWALDYLKYQCSNARVVSDEEIVTGTFLTGRQSKTYSVFVKCG